jgi:UDP-N-acetylglucosamine--N-acetylmuramyl-(pentapeptide) pyrophosphoryl-undecaprenol N-acetylglucosamine transferase
MALGLQADRPVLLLMGGSQGASGINRLVQNSIPLLTERAPELQYLHLSGPEDGPKLQAAYAQYGARAVVRPFLTEMDLALSAATLAVNRAGASSLAELAAMQVPAVLVPYPHATDNHQHRNAQGFVETGAALVLEQAKARPEDLVKLLVTLLNDSNARTAMQRALQQWYFPRAAEQMAEHIFGRLALTKPEAGEESAGGPNVPLSLPKSWKGTKFKLAPAKTGQT